MYCSAAKVPCLLGCNLTVAEPAPATKLVLETPQVYPALCCGELFRPPRV
jgi:hypothetical protein